MASARQISIKISKQIDQAYRRYLKSRLLADTAAVRFGFYSIALQYVETNPFLDPDVNARVLNSIEGVVQSARDREEMMIGNLIFEATG